MFIHIIFITGRQNIMIIIIWKSHFICPIHYMLLYWSTNDSKQRPSFENIAAPDFIFSVKHTHASDHVSHAEINFSWFSDYSKILLLYSHFIYWQYKSVCCQFIGESKGEGGGGCCPSLWIFLPMYKIIIWISHYIRVCK